MGMESQATGKLHPWWKGGKVYWHFCRAKPLVFVRKAAWEESQEMFVTCMSSVPSISQRGQGEGRRVSTVRRVIAASLLSCAHGCSSPFVLQGLTGVWVLHLSDSSISLMFMGLAGGGCAVGLWESLCLPASGALCSQVICLHPKSDVIWREEGVLGSCRGDTQLGGLSCTLTCGYVAAKLHVHTSFPSVLGVLLKSFSNSSQQLLHAIKCMSTA